MVSFCNGNSSFIPALYTFGNKVFTIDLLYTSVVDPHQFRNLDPHPDTHPHQIKIRIRIRIQIRIKVREAGSGSESGSASIF
jgi:hypothetical protein